MRHASPSRMAASSGAMRVVGEGRETALLVSGDPRVDALPRHAEAPGDLGDPPSVLHDRQHGLVPLLHDAELHEHGPPPDRDGQVSSISRSHRQGSAGAGGKDQPELRQGSGDAGMSSITRNTTGRWCTQLDSTQKSAGRRACATSQRSSREASTRGVSEAVAPSRLDHVRDRWFRRTELGSRRSPCSWGRWTAASGGGP